MNNLGTQSIHEGMQVMELPVREIKTSKPYTPKVKTIKQPVAFVPTQTARTKTNIPNRVSNKYDAGDAAILDKSLDSLKQNKVPMGDDYGRPMPVKHFTQNYVVNGRDRKALIQSHGIERKKTKKEMQAELFDRMMLLQSMFIVFYCVYLFNKQSNLYTLVAEYEAAPDLSHRALADAKKAWNGWAEQKSYDAQLEQDYACWEVNRDMLNFFRGFEIAWEQAVAAKTEAYNQELREATALTPQKNKAYKKKNPNKKKKTDTFVLAGGRMPKRYVPAKQANQQALKQVRAMFNNANRGIQYHINPGHIK